MVGMTVGALVLTGLSSVYLLSVRGAAENMRIVRLNQELRALMEVMSREIRRAGYWKAPAGADPADNPFQADRTVVTDIQISAATGEPSASCITFTYDANDNGLVGVCSQCAPSGVFSGAPYDRTNVEMFGFRLRDGAVQMRRQLGSAGESTFGCNSGRWEALTSGEVQITQVVFAMTARGHNLDAAPTASAPCVAGGLCQQVRVIEIRLTGTLATDASVSQNLTSKISVRNDRYRRS
jgi:type II secretory pathway component PulJ